MSSNSNMTVFLKEYINHYKEMLDFETEKLNMISKDDIFGMNEIIKKEQALIMQTNALEKKRLEIFGRMTFTQYIDTVIGNEKKELLNDYEILKKYILQIKKVNEQSKEIVDRRFEAVTNEKDTVTYDMGGFKKENFKSAIAFDKDI